MSASTSAQLGSDNFRRKRRRHEDIVCLQSDFGSPRHTSGAMRDAPNDIVDHCDRGIDVLTVAQSNIGQAFYQRRRRLRGFVCKSMFIYVALGMHLFYFCLSFYYVILCLRE